MANSGTHSLDTTVSAQLIALIGTIWCERICQLQKPLYLKHHVLNIRPISIYTQKTLFLPSKCRRQYQRERSSPWRNADCEYALLSGRLLSFANYHADDINGNLWRKLFTSSWQKFSLLSNRKKGRDIDVYRNALSGTNPGESDDLRNSSPSIVAMCSKFAYLFCEIWYSVGG